MSIVAMVAHLSLSIVLCSSTFLVNTGEYKVLAFQDIQLNVAYVQLMSLSGENRVTKNKSRNKKRSG